MMVPVDGSSARVVGWGSALPEKIVTNKDLEATLDTSDEWIVERTGIRERHIGGTTASLAIQAAEVALAKAGASPDTLDAIVLATTTPDYAVPATASAVQQALGASGAAFDLNAACSGFVYALVTADGLLRSGMERILVIGADTLSTIVDWDDRNTAVLVGDGAGAVLLERGEGPGRILASDLGSDGSLLHVLQAPKGGYLHMDGKEVFRRAVRIMVDCSQKTLARAGKSVEDLTLLIPHQANTRIIDSAAQKLGVDPEKVVNILSGIGNTSSASIPLALCAAMDEGRLSAGDLVLMVGFGAGMTWASALLEWAV
jgi:3-oxoacyl-[acyl-carrier-protein] synthase-3